MKLIVSGTRIHLTAKRQSLVEEWLSIYFEHLKCKSILVGDATGVDAFVVEWCKSHGIPHVKYAANWDDHGKAAGPIRNGVMANQGDCLLAFPDIFKGKYSPGTADMIRKVQAMNKPVMIVPLHDGVVDMFYKHKAPDNFTGILPKGLSKPWGAAEGAADVRP